MEYIDTECARFTRYYMTKEASEYMNKSEAAIRKLIARGSLFGVKLEESGRLLTTKAAMDAYLEQR